MPFERTSFPGLTVLGKIEDGSRLIDLRSLEGWEAQIDETISYPTGLVDDVFLHVSQPSLFIPESRPAHSK
jgi:hypothetical protein